MKCDGLALSGGGIRGYYHLGAVDYIYKHCNPEEIKIFSGTSIGAAICLLLCVGYTPQEIFNYISRKKLTVNTINLSLMIQEKGIVSLEPIMSLLTRMLERKRISKSITFGQLLEKTGKSLYIVGTNTSRNYNMEAVFCSENYQDMQCLDAVRISCSFPVFFPTVQYNDDYYIDGGAVNNFPVDILSDKCQYGIGIVLHKGDDTAYHGESFFEYIYKILVIPLEHINNVQCKRYGSEKNANLKIIEVYPHKKISQFSDPDFPDKADMFIHGNESAKRCLKTEYIYVEGWQ